MADSPALEVSLAVELVDGLESHVIRNAAVGSMEIKDLELAAIATLVSK